MSEKFKPTLAGVPETMLWPLHNRAAEARRPDTLLPDPESVRIAENIDYDFERNFGRPDLGHVFRAIAFDMALRSWLAQHPACWVTALGEGLETQFHRVDNGQVHWLSVDLPESIQVREKFIPNTNRHRNLSCSALDFRWMGEVPAGEKHVFLTAAGLLMYFTMEEARSLVAATAARFPGGAIVFDTIPHWVSHRAMRGWKKTAHYTLPPMPWGIDLNELPLLRTWHPNIAEVIQLPYPHGRHKILRWIFRILSHVPKVRNIAPAFVQLKFGDGTTAGS